MSGAAARRLPQWWPCNPEEAAAVDELLREQVRTTQAMAGQIGRLEGRVDDLARRQDRHDATAQVMDEKLDRVLANQDRFKWAGRIGWGAAVAITAISAWAWDHWPLFGGR